MQNISQAGRPLEFDPEKTREAIMQLFWERGFAAVSMPELEARTGLSRSSLYNTFGSKQEIFEGAIRRYQEAMMDRMCRPLEEGRAGLADLRRFLVAAQEQFTRKSGATGCLMVNSMVEFGGADKTVAQASAEHVERLRRAFQAALRRAVKLGEIPPGEVSVKADLILGLLLGINVASRAGLAQGVIESLVKSIRTQVEAWARAG